MQTYQHQQEIDIICAMLTAVRDSLGAMLTPEAEQAIETKLRTMWGGQDVYVKKQDVDVYARALDIRTRYNMCNRLELQKEYGLSRGHFYKILKGG
jgi:Mor family transcriptional regulator